MQRLATELQTYEQVPQDDLGNEEIEMGSIDDTGDDRRVQVVTMSRTSTALAVFLAWMLVYLFLAGIIDIES